MKIIMVKKKGCNPCKMFEPKIKDVAIDNSIGFKVVQAEEMPEKMRPKFYPFFYLMNNDDLLESWAGTSTRKMTKVLTRHIKDFIYNE